MRSTEEKHGRRTARRNQPEQRGCADRRRVGAVVQVIRSRTRSGKHNIAGKNRTQKTEANLCTVSVTRRCWFDKTVKLEPHLTIDGLQCREKPENRRTTEAAHDVLLRAFQTTFTSKPFGKPGAIKRESGQAVPGVSPSGKTRIRFRNIVRLDRHDLVRSSGVKQASL